MKCLKCQSENREGVKFCEDCGSSMELVCPSCSARIPMGKRFCGECGQSLTVSSEAPEKDLSFDQKIAKIQRYLPEGLTEKILSQKERIEGERKQVTVMFCDMEGFTALTERLGPEEAYATMDDVYEILIHKVHDYEGTVNEMTGDGIVALFGAPIALEDAPQRAIRSAMAIHREMVRFSERISGEKSHIPSLKMRIGIHSGPVVVGTLGNDLRVEFKAVGDTVNLASRMEELAKPGTTYVSGETFRLTEGLFRFEALGARQIKGKEEPVSVYQAIAPSTRRTRFDVGAERGLTPFVGRERELELLHDGFERAKAGSGQAFSIVAEAGLGKSRLLYEFRKAVANEDITFLEGKSLSYSRGIAYHPVIDVLKSNFDIRDEDGVSQIVEKVRESLKAVGADEASTLPYILDVLSVEQNDVKLKSLTPETRKERIIEACRTIVLKGAEFRPLTIVIEDLHWVDKSSEDVFRALLEGIAGARVLLIFTFRPEFVHTWGAKSYHNQLNLVHLVLAWSHFLMGDFEGALEVKEDLIRATEQGFNRLAYVRGLSCISLAYSVLGRWNEATEEGQKALRAAEELSDNSMISFAAFSISDMYLRTRDLDRAIEYGQLSVQKSQTPANEAWAKGYLAAAWILSGEPEKAIEVLETLVGICRASRFVMGEVGYLPSLGEAYRLAGEFGKAKQTLRDGLELAARLGAKYNLAEAHRVMGQVVLETDPTQAITHFEKSIDLFQECKAQTDLALAYSGMGRYHKLQGNREQAREYLTKALQIFERLGTLIEPDKVRKELAELPQ